MKKSTNKKGVALLSLLIAIMASLIIIGLITYSTSDIISESKRIAYAKDTKVVHDAVQEYYAVNGAIPILEDGLEMDAEAYKATITTSDYLTVLSNEITNNGDENATFYEIDMSKIGIKDIKYGTKKTDTDLFLVSNISNMIYYYPGKKINKDIYFSSTFIIDK